MVRKLREELIKLSTDIITARDDQELTVLYERAKGVYEKLAVLKFIDEKLSDVEVDVSKNVIASRFEKMANAVLSGNISVPETNPHKEDIITPGMDTIKDMVSEMPSETAVEHFFTEFVAKPETIKSDKEVVTPVSEKASERRKSLNDTLVSKYQIGLNDKLAFTKYLFNDNANEYEKVIAQLNSIETEERSKAFIINMVKPEYNNWEGKEAYEERLMGLIERRFA